jgi:hypothetical protein
LIWGITGDRHGAGGKRSLPLFKKNQPMPVVYIGLAVVLIVIAALAPNYYEKFLWLKPDSDSLAQWFERSGAITTIFGLLAINLLEEGVQRLLPAGKVADLANVHTFSMFEFSFKVLKVVAFLLTLAGTLIWGYGTVLKTHFG